MSEHGADQPREPRPRVLGKVVDEQTRCEHYRTPLDIVAIRFACCLEYYPCHACHDETAGHPAAQWPRTARQERAILCGACGTQLTIASYLDVTACPACAAPFNPRCALHRERYFQA